MLTTALFRIYGNGEHNPLPPVQPPRTINIIQIVFTFVFKAGFEVDIALICVCFGGGRDRVKHPTCSRRQRCLM